MVSQPRFSAFGLTVAAGFEVAGVADEGHSDADLTLRLAADDNLVEAWSGPADPPARSETTFADGCRYFVERGRGGDLLFGYGARASFLLEPGTSELLCAPGDPEAPAWRRVLLDSVLATVSMERGFEALHAGAVCGPAGVIAAAGQTGVGKTSLVLALLERGHELFSDDILALSTDDGAVLAHPGPPVMNVPGPQAAVGELLAELDDEAWVALDRPLPPPPQQPSALVILERDPGVPGAIERVTPPTPVALLPYALSSGRSPERRARRFHLLCDLAEAVPTYRLQSGSASPSETADLVEGVLARVSA